MVRISGLLSLFVLMLFGCGPKKDNFTDTFTSGVIRVAVDESFGPVITQEAAVFEVIYPRAGIQPVFVSEREALTLFLRDSVRVAITTRPLMAQETALLEERKMYPKDMVIGYDGIALITSPGNQDSLISVDQLRAVLTGEVRTWEQLRGEKSGKDTIRVVFDHSESSTLRYMVDSLCPGKTLSAHLFAQNNNPDVIRYVSQNSDALGIIGVTWVGERNDSTGQRFIDEIRVMAVSADNPATPENSYKPYQAYIALREYPLIRNIYALLNDPRGALPTGFYTFLSSDRGQRILLKAGIVPATQPVRIVNAGR